MWRRNDGTNHTIDKLEMQVLVLNDCTCHSPILADVVAGKNQCKKMFTRISQPLEFILTTVAVINVSCAGNQCWEILFFHCFITILELKKEKEYAMRRAGLRYRKRLTLKRFQSKLGI